MHDWQETTLGDEVDLLTGFPFQSSEYLTDETQPKLLRGDNIIQGQLRWENSKHWDIASTKGLDAYFLEAGDVVLAMDRPWIEAGLKYSEITRHDLPALLVQRVSRFRGTSSIISKYIKYVIGSKNFTDYVLNIQTGTAVPHISSGQIKSFGFLLPPLHEQKAIAAILGALDDKIELNRRMNAILEAMARALFKSWFVDFDPVRAKMEGKQPFGMDSETAALFPSRLVPSELGDIPEEWSIEKLGEVSRITIGRTPPRKEQACFVNSPLGTTWLSIRDMAEGSVYAFKSSEGLTVESIEQYRVPIIPKNTVIVSFKLTVGRVALTGKPMATNEAIAHIHIDESPIRSPLYLYCFMKQYDFTQLASTSSIATAVNSESIRGMKVLLPDERAQLIFHDHVKNIFEKVYANLLEIKNLEETRDYLLPKLISGDIRIPDAEKFVEAA